MKKHTISLKNKLFLLVAVSVAPSLLAAFSLNIILKNEALSFIKSEIANKAYYAAQMQHAVFKAGGEALELLLAMRASPRFNDFLQELNRDAPYSSGILYFEKGKGLAAASPPDWLLAGGGLQTTLDDIFVQSGLALGSIADQTGRPHLFLAQTDARRGQAAVMLLDTAQIFALLRNEPFGNLFAHDNSAYAFYRINLASGKIKPLLGEKLAPDARAALSLRVGQSSYTVKAGKETWLCSDAEIFANDTHRFVFQARSPLHRAFLLAFPVGNALFAVMIANAVLALVFAWSIANGSILYSVKAMLSTLKRLEAGDLSARMRFAGNDEMSRLAIGIDRMAASLERRTQQMNQAAMVDDLTKIYNRRYFMQRAEELYRSQSRLGCFAIVIFDIDHFKKVNDTYGHLAGDEVLRAAAKLLAGVLRREDIFARYGGEEFIALLPAATETEAFAAAERARKTIEKRSFLLKSGAAVQVTISAGAALSCSKKVKLNAVISLADHALYQAKNKGRNQTAIAVLQP